MPKVGICHFLISFLVNEGIFKLYVNNMDMSSKDIAERWRELLNPITFRDRTAKHSTDGRNPFEDDYSRLLFSSPFRRLQDKTQVFLLDKSDFLRTRLTHSLEVSTIARSIGSSLQKRLLDDKKLFEQFTGHIPALLAASGLVHDIGNPPFGHFGEEAIKKFYVNLLDKEKFKSKEYHDLINFDGNVQTFRILSKLTYLKDEHSYNLTFPMLSSVIKYPKSSILGNKEEAVRKSISEKKFGYFVTEEDKFTDINSTLSLKSERHPIVFLMESADDIAYSAADIEDGVKFGALSYSKVLGLLEESKSELSSNLKNYFENEYKHHSEKDRLNLSIQRIRIDSHRLMIPAVIEEFLNNHENILQGSYTSELIENSTAKQIRKAFKKMAYVVFDHPVIIEREIASYKIIHGLLEEFCQAAESEDFGKNGRPQSLENKLYKSISSNYRYIYETYPGNANSMYLKYQLINDYISGMTDSFAMKLYQKFKGIRL
jgi:dGTPase